ncbi:adenosylcobinamide-phosphate synthase CbiB [Lentibacillus saliphilus]|uniref:adenosylcobinamide-phosphate synthase CbiB n=1 Tax=Lentibacillus saliphilus TaxID=2737028 RepID=UPI001C3007A1|nr:adenosylcobinamide-phosphate synthase CbiB [Lentibacillus saliphilus]
MIWHHLAAIIIACVLDLLIGDPKHWPHPVKWIGALIAFLDQHLNQDRYRKAKGALLVVTVVTAVFVPSILIIYTAYDWNIIFGIVLEAFLIVPTIAQKSLREAALDVYKPLQNNDLSLARKRLSWIVGRDTDKLDEGNVVRGAVETVAENTSDGISAPLFWALIGGAPFALAYRAVNTCDSMVGYRNEQYYEFGWASARFDDVLNWIPARLTGMLMLLVHQPKHDTKKEAWNVFRRDALKHNSPNSGWGESAVAALLGVQLGGMNTYQGVPSEAPLIGNANVPLERHHIVDAVSIMQRTIFAFIMSLVIGGVIIEFTITWF